MNELVYLKHDEVVCDSLQVAEKFGKRHGNVMRDILLISSKMRRLKTKRYFIKALIKILKVERIKVIL